ncbi:MAG: hypothetical protein ABIT08_14495, partial [Bacteroidia bacterium]
METFIAFFDVLGFKEFIFNNTLDIVKDKFNLLLTESETAVSSEKFVQKVSGSYEPDLTKQKVNCIHISDSIIFWTNGNT